MMREFRLILRAGCVDPENDSSSMVSVNRECESRNVLQAEVMFPQPLVPTILVTAQRHARLWAIWDVQAR
jgi:hypothetical protein